MNTQAIVTKIKKNRLYITLYLITLCIFVLYIILAFRSWNIDSDFVALQVLLKNAHFNESSPTWLGVDTFVIKYPLYYFFNIFQFSDKIILIQSICQFLFGYTLFYYSFVYFVKKFRVNWAASAVSLVWISSTSVLAGLFFFNPNSRVMEFGLVFLAFVLIDKFMISAFDKNKKFMYLVVILSYGLISYSDPFVFIMGLAPVIIYLVINQVNTSFSRIKQEIILILLLVFVSSKIFGVLFKLMGIHNTSEPTSIIHWNEIGAHVSATALATVKLFNGYFFGGSILDVSTVYKGINLLVVIFIVYTAITLVRRTKEYFWQKFFVFAAAFQVIVYFISKHDIDSLSARFLILVPFFCVFILILGISKQNTRQRIILLVLIVILSVVNLLAATKKLTETPYRLGQVSNKIVVDIVNNGNLEDYTKVYADYWEAGITTFKSKNDIIGIQVLCDNKPTLFRWWVNEEVLRRSAAKTAFVLDSSFMPNCSEQDVINQFGAPVKVIQPDPKVRIYIYNYDIGTNLVK